MPTNSRKRLAYLSSEYPALSHTFIFREIMELRRNGFFVQTVSVNSTTLVDRFSAIEKEEIINTYYIKKHIFIKTGVNFLISLFTEPLMTAKAFFRSVLLMHSRKGLLKAVGYFFEAVILKNWMKRNKIFHMHVHFGNPAATLALIASTFRKIEYSMSIHGPDVFYDIDQNILAEKIMYAKSVRAISFFCRSQLFRLVSPQMWDKISIVRCGIDTSVFAPQQGVSEKAVPEILCVGRLVPAKGQRVLLEALRLLDLRNIQFHATIAGGGPNQEDLENIAREYQLDHRVIFTGPIGQDAVINLYRQADIFVLASFAEGLPVVLMEAMAMEVASISTYIAGIPELVVDGQNGLLVYPSDIQGLFQKILLLLENTEYRRKLAIMGRKKVEEEYDIQKNSMSAFFEGLI